MSTSPGGMSPRETLRRQQEQAARRARERRWLTIVAIGLVVVVVGGIVGFQLWRSSRAPSSVPATVSGFAPVSIVNGKPIVLGAADAPVKLQLFEDFHCPHCADFERELGPTITAEQQAGKVAVELYPMSFIDQGSASAANAMACAAENGFGQEYYLGLFANPDLAWSDSQLQALATKVSSSVPSGFGTCVTTKAHQPWVDSINAAAQAVSVESTPTLWIDKSPVDIATLTPDSLRSMIEQAAAK
jgi:protein-disulfide isomerase